MKELWKFGEEGGFKSGDGKAGFKKNATMQTSSGKEG